MADDDKALFDSAIEEQVTPAQEPEQPDTEQANRDERGRFAPKAAKEEPKEEPKAVQPQAEIQPEAKPPEQERADIPAWRLREEAEARRNSEARASQAEREVAELRRAVAQLQEQTKPQPKVPDMFEDPNAFVDHGVRAAVDPVKQEIARLREDYSKRDAIREHGGEKVKAAFDALDRAARSGDAEAIAVVARVKESMHPFGDMVDWHTRQTVYSQIGPDPAAWFEKQLEERLKDPAQQAKLMERVRGQVQTQRPPVTQLPPSLNKATSGRPSDDEDDSSDSGLLKSALRR